MKKKHTSRKNKIDAGKIGTIFLVTMVALAGAGIAYSMWTQELTITGIINTGEVKIGLHDFKTLDSGPSISEGGSLYPLIDDPSSEHPEIYGTADPYYDTYVNTDGKNIASHNSYTDGIEISFTKTIEGEDYIFKDHVTEIVNGVYPWYASGTTIFVGNGGTIPVKITDVSYHYVSGIEQLLEFLVIDSLEIKEYNSNTQSGWSLLGSGISLDELVILLDCYQLDPCHTISIDINFHFKEELEDETVLPEGKSLTFEIYISAAQWNEVPCGDTPPVICYPDLSIEKTVEYLAGQPYMGSTIEYTITVTNNGNCNAENVQVTDNLPFGVTYVDHTCSPGPDSNYDESTGIWDIGTLPYSNTATLTITATIIDTGATATAPTQLALVLDGSSSISTYPLGNPNYPGEWELMLEGTANAIEDPTVFPHDGSIELTVVQFGGDRAEVEVDTEIIYDLTTAQTVATTIRGIDKDLGTTTPLGEGLDLTAATLAASVDFDLYPRKVINIVTDGNPTYPPINAELVAIQARNDLLLTLGMVTADDGEIDAEAIGLDADVEWLRANIVWPGSYVWLPPALPTGPGWVRYVEDFTGFEEAIRGKFETILVGIENCATLNADNFDPVQTCITIDPIPV